MRMQLIRKLSCVAIIAASAAGGTAVGRQVQPYQIIQACLAAVTGGTITTTDYGDGHVVVNFTCKLPCTPGMTSECNWCLRSSVSYHDPIRGWLIGGNGQNSPWVTGCNVTGIPKLKRDYQAVEPGQYKSVWDVYGSECASQNNKLTTYTKIFTVS